MQLNYLEYLSGNQAKHLVVLLHGLGSNGNRLMNALGYKMGEILTDTQFISPNAPEEFVNYIPEEPGYQWFDVQDRSENVMWSGVERASVVVSDFIDQQLARFGLDDNNLSLVGFSQGAMLSIHVALTRRKKCSSVVAYSGRVILPLKLKEKITAKPEVCVIHGTDDQVVPFSCLNEAVSFLSDNDIPVKSHSITELGHFINDNVIKIGAEFIKKNLLK